MKEIQGLGGKFSRRQFLTLTGGVVTTTVLASCVATEQGGGGAGADTAVTEFSFAWWTGGEGANKLFEESIDHFEEKHPEYSINRISAPYGEFGTKILTMYGSGNAPDAHGVPWGTVWSWANKGVLLDLTPFVEADNTIDWEGMWPAVTGGCRFPADK
ncbi:MAG: extracellular solute-binding protein, partial [Caldilineaceae bacterium]|nr:extracellular solute-binding protein [Caldilineaceae bacterium]